MKIESTFLALTIYNLYFHFIQPFVIKKFRVTCSSDDHYPVYRLDIRQDSEFATGYGYPKTIFKREPDI